MFNVKIPINKYWKTNYPNLEDRAEGQCIPYLWGHKHNIVPVCINTSTLTYKICEKIAADRDALSSIDLVAADDSTLVEGAALDYTTDLEDGEFTVRGSPYLEANTSYYFDIVGNWAINGTDYLYSCGCDDGWYANGVRYDIDAGGTWNIFASGGSIGFRIYGREQVDGEEALMVNFQYEEYWPGIGIVPIRQAVANTRIGQKFKTGANPFYVTKIVIPLVRVGACAGQFYSQVFTAIAPENQLSINSNIRDCGEVGVSWYDMAWKVRGTPTKIVVQATVAVDKVRDIIEEVYEHVLGGNPVTDLKTADFDALDAVKTEDLGIYLDGEITVKEFLETLESGQLFKFLPTLDRKYTVKFGQVGDPPGTPWFHDEDFLSFKCKRLWKSIFGIIKLQYNQDPESQEWATETHASNISDYIYKNTETLTLETKLIAQADAIIRVSDYSTLLEYPLKLIIFEVSCGSGFSLMPMDKVKISRTRGDNTNGTFDGVLFCVLEVNKNVVEGTAVITAILDTQTYVT